MNGYTLFINCYRLLTFVNRRFRLKGLTTDSYLGIYKRNSCRLCYVCPFALYWLVLIPM